MTSRKPWIGLIGMVMLIIAWNLGAENDTRFFFCTAPMALIGVMVLAYAVMAGHTPLFGR